MQSQTQAEGGSVTTPRGKNAADAAPPKLGLLPSHRRKVAFIAKIGAIAQKIPIDQGCLLVQFVHWVVDEVCGRQPDWTKPFGEANAQPMIDAVKLFVIKAVGGGLKKDDRPSLTDDFPLQIVRELKGFNVADEHATVIVDCILVRYTDVQKALAGDTAHISPAHLKDFDWKLLHSLASDKVATVNEPILRLNLTIKDENEKMKDVVLELPKSELDKLIGTLQQVNQVVQKLRV
ncbi:COMM domain containing protein 8, putative [Acanthamoeba castellanii str. Neff]|uniref:COMM domain containing protein 8, putative n=1 Tax=Acanthamoeba castellanii (strain ATCC 30010 / Neff) TaxID=1257118 RepID=L8HGA6_ACACF|nr:COMM domain containing protein 8, putative [Acanthamoeba castellanii str. Neff]ELR24564.1 COMM domain containing protein 8, putative [Acanthamoeba castellanii str. Neff]